MLVGIHIEICLGNELDSFLYKNISSTFFTHFLNDGIVNELSNFLNSIFPNMSVK